MRADEGGGGSGGGIDTEIKGKPGSVESAASWLRGSAATGISEGAHALQRARSEATSDWGGDAGPAFASRMQSAHGKATALQDNATRCASALDSYAGSLRSCQDRMTGIRERAAGAGLTVHGFVIQDPGPGPARPPDRSGERMPLPQLEAYEASVREYNAHQQLITAYSEAATAAGEVRTTYAQAAGQLADEYDGMSWLDATLNGTDFVAGAVLSRMSRYHAKILDNDARYWAREADRWRDYMRNKDYRSVGDPRRVYDLDAQHQDYLDERARTSGSAADDAVRTERFGGLAKGVSRGLVGVGILVDLHDGESVPQAVASNVGGYAAGVGVTVAVDAGTTMLAATAAGAAMGSAVPVVGTAVGAVVGLGVGVFASGAIDSLFENGPDVGAAWDAGTEAVTDTVGAVGDGIKSAAGFVGGLFD
jgi:uncharacterized protein YukE